MSLSPSSAAAGEDAFPLFSPGGSGSTGGGGGGEERAKAVLRRQQRAETGAVYRTDTLEHDDDPTLDGETYESCQEVLPGVGGPRPTIYTTRLYVDALAPRTRVPAVSRLDILCGFSRLNTFQNVLKLWNFKLYVNFTNYYYYNSIFCIISFM